MTCKHPHFLGKNSYDTAIVILHHVWLDHVVLLLQPLSTYDPMCRLFYLVLQENQPSCYNFLTSIWLGDTGSFLKSDHKMAKMEEHAGSTSWFHEWPWDGSSSYTQPVSVSSQHFLLYIMWDRVGKQTSAESLEITWQGFIDTNRNKTIASKIILGIK